jgi:hypothetical protein
VALAYVTFDLNAKGSVLLDFSVRLVGWALRNKSVSNPANIDLYDGADTSGTPVFPVTLAANESVRDLFPDGGVLLLNALYANITLGEVAGCVVYQLPATPVPVLRYGR